MNERANLQPQRDRLRHGRATGITGGPRDQHSFRTDETDGLVIATPRRKITVHSLQERCATTSNDAPNTIQEKASIADGTHRLHRSIDVLHQDRDQSLTHHTFTRREAMPLWTIGVLRSGRVVLARPSNENSSADQATAPGAANKTQ
jgi:hypothetical protein